MKYVIDKKRLPKKSNDTTIMKCILRAIHDHFHVDKDLLKVTEAKYKMYYDALEQNKVITLVSNKYTPEGYSVLDSKLYKSFLNKKDLSLQLKVSVPFVDLSVDLSSTTIKTEVTTK